MPPEAFRTTLLVMRHGETSWNRDLRIMGAADVPLNEAGRSQCVAVSRLLGGFSIDAVVSSPLRRARETADIVAAALGLGVREDADLSEVRFGRWQGMTYDQVMADPDYAKYARDPCGSPTPGGETILDVQARGLAALQRVEAGTRTLFVSHGDIIRSTLCHYLAVPVAEYRRLRVDNCGLSAVVAQERRAEVKFVNLLADPVRVWDGLHWGTAR